jgi:hypothetical protein
MDPLAYLATLGLCAAAIVGIAWRRVRAEAKAIARQSAYEAYQHALRLKRDPTNADHKQHAVQVGRAYANLTCDQKGVTGFNDVALSNDIRAATAGVTAAKAVARQRAYEAYQYALRLKRDPTNADHPMHRSA